MRIRIAIIVAMLLLTKNASGDPLGDAAQAILAAFAADGAWPAAARYLDARARIVIDEWDNDSGADEPVAERQRHIVHGAAGLRRWLDHKYGGHPERGESLSCAASCCASPFIDNHPYKYNVTKLCFDARLHLRFIETWHSGM